MAELKVEGYTEFVRSLAQADKAVGREVRTRLRLVGESVRAGGESRFSHYGSAAAGASVFGGTLASHADSAQGYKVKVRQRGVDVEQTKPKTTGRHKEYGSAQMRHGLLPAMYANAPFLARQLEAAMRDVAEIVNRSHG